MVKEPWPVEPDAGAEPPPRSIRPSVSESRLVLWPRRWSILAITLLVVVAALFASSRRTPVYESTVRILVVPVEVGTESAGPEDLNLATESEVISSGAVAEIVAENLDIPGPPRTLLEDVIVDQPEGTEILEVSYRHPDPLQAQRRATGFAEGYLQYRQGRAAEEALRLAEGINREIEVLSKLLGTIQHDLDDLPKDDPGRFGLETQAQALMGRILDRQVARLSLSEEVTVGRIIQPAARPTSPVSPNHVTDGILGLVAGLGLGVGFAFLRDRLSGRFRSPEEAEAYLEAPIFGAIPRVPGWRRGREAFLVTAVQWRSPPAEAYRVLRTNLLSAASDLGVKSIVVTSAHSGEGKSATVANLGVVLARAGKRVSLVSADLRRPRLHEFFRREEDVGLVDVLAGSVPLAGALQEIKLPTSDGFGVSQGILRLLSSGRVQDDPRELLTSEKMTEVLKDLEEISDIVLIDVPPILPVTDALVVATVVKHVLFVVGPKTGTRSMISARQQLDRVGARILGTTLSGPADSMVQTHSY